MSATCEEKSRDFYDVSLSYRHRDTAKIDELERKIQAYGFVPFRDLNFPHLRDTSDVTREKIETIRGALSRATCLIFVYSRTSAVEAKESDSSVGEWMPWEPGFFDGSISARIGVYLLDGEPEHFDAKSYFKGSEYLQIYDADRSQPQGFSRP